MRNRNTGVQNGQQRVAGFQRNVNAWAGKRVDILVQIPCGIKLHDAVASKTVFVIFVIAFQVGGALLHIQQCEEQGRGGAYIQAVVKKSL